MPRKIVIQSDLEESLESVSDLLVGDVATACAASPNEASLRHEVEKILEALCLRLKIPWVNYTLDKTLAKDTSVIRFADALHGAVVIEYEPPASFGGRDGAKAKHAREQAEEYAVLIQKIEGRTLGDYVLVAWDGASIQFGHHTASGPKWDRLTQFDRTAAKRLLQDLKDNGTPLVNPTLLANIAGPETRLGRAVIPLLYAGAKSATAPKKRGSKTKILYTEWKRLFGQVAGVQSDGLRLFLRKQGDVHGADYTDDPSAYLFALNTYIAIVAKFIAAMSLPRASQNLADSSVPLEARLGVLESGKLFATAGVLNLLTGDLFSWYLSDKSWVNLRPHVETLLNRLGQLNYDTAEQTPESTRDLFKGLYQSFVPEALRHALGEYYTPDWLAEYVVDQSGWQLNDSMIDPTCGSGTFILEVLKRRLASGKFASAADLLHGLYGIDLNPLAVLAARASVVVYIAPYIDPDNPIELPIFLADAINSSVAEVDSFKHSLQTECGVVHFKLPALIVEHSSFYALQSRMRDLIDAGLEQEEITKTLISEFALELTSAQRVELKGSIGALCKLHARGWDGIWCAILAERFKAGAIPQVGFVVGNPPWVKWSHLPPEYAEFIKPQCLALGVFSKDRWVGGIEADISTVITYEAARKWLKPKGTLAFLITGTVFSNESSAGFRRFALPDSSVVLKVIEVCDFAQLRPFEGVSNHPTMLLLKKGERTQYPIPYIMWDKVPGQARPEFASANEFLTTVTSNPLLAMPVPGTDSGPWLKGSKEQFAVWSQLFGAGVRVYSARKGVTTDANGIFFVRLIELRKSGKLSLVENDPIMGRNPDIPQVRGEVETEHLFPLLRGRGVSVFKAISDPEHYILVPQRGMHGDGTLPFSAPKTYAFLERFKVVLEARSSLRRFQKGQPYWSLWSTGSYTFSEWKVVWKEMSGGQFQAGYMGPLNDPIIGEKVVVPDHKVYFVAVSSEVEAAFLCGVLNAPTIAAAISAYASQLSLGVSVVEYMHIPEFKPSSRFHLKIAALAQKLSLQGDKLEVDLATLDRLVLQLLGVQLPTR